MCRPLVGTSYTLKALEHDAANQASQMDALRSSDASLALINANYQAGLVNYLQVLTVNSQYQQARIAYLQILTQPFRIAWRCLLLWAVIGIPQRLKYLQTNLINIDDTPTP
jgi:hypothetical protein